MSEFSAPLREQHATEVGVSFWVGRVFKLRYND